MKKVWIGLSAGCILIGITGTIGDMLEGNSFEDSALALFVMVLLAIFFGWLAWLWRLRSPLKRMVEQVGAVVDGVKENNEA